MALLIAGGGTQVFTSNACTCAAVSLLQGCSNCCCCRTFCLLLNGPASARTQCAMPALMRALRVVLTALLTCVLPTFRARGWDVGLPGAALRVREARARMQGV
eukprot:scaffold32617_cov20-Tisochrysis_lutea.AAC.1